MPTGPKAGSKTSTKNATLMMRLRETQTLLAAWHAIRRNGETSTSRQTREEVRKFGADLPRQLRRLQERLRPPYAFAKQYGATPFKDKSKPEKGKRPLVIAPLPDRIVQRAILNVLQDAHELEGVQRVLATPTSVGGIRGRGVDDAIRLIEAKRLEGEANFVAGSDISGFFTTINKASVVDFMRGETDDDGFVDLFKRALDVELLNVAALGPEDYAMFPTAESGVAQGCPLSAFAGNVALRDFDHHMNGNGVTCIRYIDDFILVSAKKSKVEKAFKSAAEKLAALDMKIYRPEENPSKAFIGEFAGGFEFLGYQLKPGLYPPSKKNQQRLLDAIRLEFKEGERHILRALHEPLKAKALQRYAQTLVEVDNRVKAWSGTFKESRCIEAAKAVDAEINKMIGDFISFYSEQSKKVASQTQKRRLLGVHIVEDDIRARGTHV
jgi:RNA-directed DNA polymerase